MKKLTVNSDPSLHDCLGAIRAAYKKDKFLRVSIATGKARSLDSNALAWVFYDQISRELGEGSPEDIHCECKLLYAVPILVADDPDFATMYKPLETGLSYDEKLAAMRYLPATSLMTKDQMRRYLDDIQKAYAQRGVILEAI